MTQQPPSTTPAGWYQDDTGTTRWWDGSAWTEHTAPVAPAAPEAASSVDSAPVAAAAAPAVAAPALAPRNGLGIAALVLGIVGILFGFIPFTFFVAGTLGLIGFILGIVGWRRAKSGAATNKKMAIAGIVTSLIAMIMAVVGIVILVSVTSHAI